MKRVFVSGPTGCIGAATVAYLLDHGVSQVIGFSRQRDFSRIPERYHDRLEWLPGDICDASTVSRAVADSQPTHIIHLAAFQTPDCQAHPLQGLDVNVTGSINLFRAAAALDNQLQRFVFASSAAVYGSRELYPSDTVGELCPYQPPNLYGYWKVAGEGMAQAFHRETQIATVSLRLATTYGPGRDRGLTSAPTTAIKRAAEGVDFQMPYQGREHYHFVSDVGAGFAQAALESFSGYGVFNLRGQTVEVSRFLETIRQEARAEGLSDTGHLGFADDATTMPFVCDLDDRAILSAFPNMPLTSLNDGVRQSLRVFGNRADSRHPE